MYPNYKGINIDKSKKKREEKAPRPGQTNAKECFRFLLLPPFHQPTLAKCIEDEICAKIYSGIIPFPKHVTSTNRKAKTRNGTNITLCHILIVTLLLETLQKPSSRPVATSFLCDCHCHGLFVGPDCSSKPPMPIRDRSSRGLSSRA